MFSKIILAIVIFILTIFLYNETNRENTSLILFIKHVEAYTDTKNYEVKFMTEKNEVCAVGELIHSKVYAYRKIFCVGKGEGYIHARSDGYYQIHTP